MRRLPLLNYPLRGSFHSKDFKLLLKQSFVNVLLGPRIQALPPDSIYVVSNVTHYAHCVYEVVYVSTHDEILLI